MSSSQTERRIQDPRAQLRDGARSAESATLRLAALRAEIPEAIVQIDAVRADDTAIAIKVTIGLPGGARHSGLVAADVDPAHSWAEKMDQVQADAVLSVLDGLGWTLERVSRGNTPSPQPREKPTQASSSEDDHLPEFSWNAFWQQANARTISKVQVEQALGRSVQEATPKEAITALQKAGIWT